jgi:hypothetical protein
MPLEEIVLLPHWNSKPTKAEIIFGLNERENPPEWKPDLQKLENVTDPNAMDAFAFPTPFAWAEMMSIFIRQHKTQHHLFKLYRHLVLGLVLGHLELDIIDLAPYDFGKVLVETDRRYHYFGLLRGRSSNAAIQGKVFGGTSPETLFWPSPRRSSGEWAELAREINGSPNFNSGFQVLADFRAVLQDAGLWNPDAAKHPSHYAIEQIINQGGGQPSDGYKYYHQHSRTVGPILSRAGDGSFKRLYFPVYEEGFAVKFLESLTGDFEREDDRIDIYDNNRLKQYEILMPAHGDLVLGGGGTFRIERRDGNFPVFQSTHLRLQDDRGEGIFTLMQPLYQALNCNVTEIRQFPFFYPDLVRLGVERLGEAGIPGTHVTFSDQAINAVFARESRGLPLTSEVENDAGQLGTSPAFGFVLRYTRDGVQRKAVYMETIGGREVADLRAVGWLLWLLFTGEADFSNGVIRNKDGLRLLKEAQARPLDVNAIVYQKLTMGTLTENDGSEFQKRRQQVLEERHRNRRLATLQRFVRAYAERLNAATPTDADRLSHAAAVAFAEWAWGGQVTPNGHHPTWQPPLQSGDLRIIFAKDESR